MLIKEISEMAEEVGLDNVDPVGIIEVLESHSHPLSNEELYDLDQQLTEQQKEKEDEEDRATKAVQTKDLIEILSATDMAAEKLCNIEPVWERSSKVA
jgi:desulfoferrodoxin (superoxide reductase-like protein)